MSSALLETLFVSISLTSCPLCISKELANLYQARDPHYGIPGTHSIMRCRECSLVFVNPMYDDAEAVELYPDDYYAYQEAPALPAWKRVCKKILGYRLGTKDPRFASVGTVLDVGCGSGEFLHSMNAQGWIAQGVEISAAASRAGQANGLQIVSGSLPDAQFPAESFDYVRASHSLEHVSDPHAVLEEMHRVLKPDGKLLIAVPNVDSWNAKLFGQYWWHLCPPLHAFSYSVHTLTRLLAQHHFQVERVTFNSDYVGILGSIQIWRNRKNGRTSSDGWLFANRAMRVLCGWLALFADRLHRGDMIEVIATKAPVKESAREKERLHSVALASR